MKVYQCDACEKAIKDPYKEKMKEFFVGCHFDYCGVFPENSKRKIKVHLCDDCFKGLHLIAEKKQQSGQYALHQVWKKADRKRGRPRNDR